MTDDQDLTSTAFIELFKHPPLRHLAEWWLAARRGRLMPDRSDVDPLELRPVLKHIWLMEPTEDRQGFRYRLAGEAIERHYQRPLRGQRQIDLLGEAWGLEAAARLHPVIARPAALYFYGVLPARRHQSGHVERAAFPLAERDGVAQCVIGASHYSAGILRNDKTVNDQPLKQIYCSLAAWC
jgi:hypothetical protein